LEFVLDFVKQKYDDRMDYEKLAILMILADQTRIRGELQNELGEYEITKLKEEKKNE